ncbi:MAG TPA: amidohydrolase [Candidatus Lachnoclostridium pullistercoris]|uniref:Amidohydrolase n=1 Tax=Candidatus Lachnoclostridium pullistercoris TaxID=2838632 RepID=A0A9D2T5U6_9FIRM|nr:amidohydrolase [Candidatus Lachnoclostridium pullistercoris]
MESRQKIIFTNGNLFTSRTDLPWADSMAVEDGVIRWVGNAQDMPEKYRAAVQSEAAGEAGTGGADGWKRVDLNGRLVIPGFVDAHMHPVMLAEFRKKIAVMPPKIHSIRELTEAVRERREAQGPGVWIEGWGYDEGELLEKRSPNRYDLDRGCSDAPVSIMRTCAHIRCVNSAALRLAGIDRNTPDPPGGEIERDENGEPTGVLKETASTMFSAFVPQETETKKADHLLELGEVLLSQGVTAICDMGNLDSSDNFDLYLKAAERGFKQKVGVYYMWDFFMDRPEFSISPEQMDRSRQIFAAGLKLIGDGSVSGRTAWMRQPYLGSREEYGISVCSDRQLETAIQFCKKTGCQLSIHAMGGRAIERMVDRVCREKPWTPDSIPYVRLEHVTDPSEESMEKAAAGGIAFVTQPIFQYAESSSYLVNLGPERMKECYPVRTMLEKGIRLGFSTDAPATFWADPSDPFPGLKQAVTRRSASGVDCGQDQAVDMETAVRLYTCGSAAAAGFSGIGMLAPGYQADFAVLSRDLFRIPPEEADQVQVEETYIGGELVYRRS